MIAVGQMDRQITAYRYSSTNDVNYGGLSAPSYSFFFNDYAHVIWKSGEVTETSDQMQNKQVLEFYVRNATNASSLTVKDYILFAGDKFYIDNINVIDGRKTYLKIIATNVAPTIPQI